MSRPPTQHPRREYQVFLPAVVSALVAFGGFIKMNESDSSLAGAAGFLIGVIASVVAVSAFVFALGWGQPYSARSSTRPAPPSPGTGDAAVAPLAASAASAPAAPTSTADDTTYGTASVGSDMAPGGVFDPGSTSFDVDSGTSDSPGSSSSSDGGSYGLD